jgi:tetratricopeptide (TPR) repeat protein
MTDTQILDFDALWNYDDPATTEQQFRQLLPAAEANSDRSYHVQLLTQIARTQGLQRQFDAAHQTLNQAEKLLTDDLQTGRVRYLLERGRVFNSSGNPDQARPLFLQVWKLAQIIHEDFYAVDAAHMLAIVAPSDEQMQWNLKALVLAESSDQPRAHKWLGSLYNNIGWTYHDQQQYDKALTIFEKALHFREAQGDPSSIRIAKWCIARTLRSLGRTQEALDQQLALHAEHLADGSKDGYVNEEIGECLLALGRSDESRPYFAQAYAQLSQDAWLTENEAPRLARLKALS